jgi:hypothetical protein
LRNHSSRSGKGKVIFENTLLPPDRLLPTKYGELSSSSTVAGRNFDQSAPYNTGVKNTYSCAPTLLGMMLIIA